MLPGAMAPTNGVLGLLAVALCLATLSLGVEGGEGLDVGEDQH